MKDGAAITDNGNFVLEEDYGIIEDQVGWRSR